MKKTMLIMTASAMLASTVYAENTPHITVNEKLAESPTNFIKGMSGNISSWEWGDLFDKHGESYIREHFTPYSDDGDKTITTARIYTQDKEFTGNYKAKKVEKASVEIKIFEEPHYPNPLMINLNIVGKYDGKYYNLLKEGDAMPRQGEGWKDYNFEIPSHSETFPEDWQMFDIDDVSINETNFDQKELDKIYTTVMKNVEEISFSIGRRDEFYFIYNSWDVGAKKMKLTTKH